jgi:lysophospholipase L1-like esterase
MSTTRLHVSVRDLLGRDVPSPRLVIEAPPVKLDDVLYSGGRTVDLDARTATLELLSTDTPNTDPTEWAYRFTLRWDGGGLPSFTAPLTGESVRFTDLQPMDPANPIYIPPLVDAQNVANLDQAVRDLAETRATTDARALRHFHTIAADPATPTNVVVIGDSIVEGLGATSWRRRWTQHLADGLRSVFQPPDVAGGAGYFTGWNQAGYADWPCDPVTPIPNSDYGLGRQSLTMTAEGASAIFDTTPVCTGLDIVVAKTNTGAADTFLQVQIDSDPVRVFDLTDADTSRGGYHLEIRGLARTTHSMIIASGGGSPIFEGVAFYDGDETSGVRVYEGGQSGFRASDFTTPHTRWMDSLVDLEPALVVLAIGSNDYETGRPVADFETDIASMCDAITSRLGYRPSFALAAYYERSSPGWAIYRAAYRRLSEQLDAALIDLSPLFGPWQADTRGGLIAADLHHPSDAGHAIIGRRVSDAIVRGATAP